MISPVRFLCAWLAALVLLTPSLEGAEVPVGSTGLVLTVPDGFAVMEKPASGLIIEIRDEKGERRLGVQRFDPAATGQLMAEGFELRMRRRYKAFNLSAQERVTTRHGGAMCRTYGGNDGETHIEVEALVLVTGDLRLVLFSLGPRGSVAELRAALLSLRTGPKAVRDDPAPDPEPAPPDVEPVPPKGQPPASAETSPKPPEPPKNGVPPRSVKPISLPGTVAGILPPAGWRGGLHAATKGVRIVDPARACIIDVAASALGKRDRNDTAVEKAADDFERQLAKDPARWKRVENRRERIDGRNTRVRRFVGTPEGLPCDFVLFVTRVGGHVLIARSVYPQVHRERYRDPVLASLRSIGRR